jgi:hypothetical protein
MRVAKTLQLALGSVVLLTNHAIAEPITSRSSRTWLTIRECWATLYPTVSLFIDEFGWSKIAQNLPDRIEHEVADAVSGRLVLRAGCVRVPNSSPAIFRRYLEIPN